MSNDLLAVLDECLAAVREGRATIAECLTTHPDIAEELGSLLPLALAIEPPAVSLAPERKDAARAAFMAALAAEPFDRTAPIVRIGVRSRGWRNSVAAAVAAALLLYSGNRALVSAEAALPGHPLYPLKTALEEVRLVTAASPGARAAVAVEIATKRREEAERASAAGDPEAESVALTAYATAVVAAAADQQAAVIASNSQARRIPTGTAEPPTSTRVVAVAVNANENGDPPLPTATAEELVSAPSGILAADSLTLVSIPTGVVDQLPLSSAVPTAVVPTAVPRTPTPVRTATRLPSPVPSATVHVVTGSAATALVSSTATATPVTFAAPVTATATASSTPEATPTLVPTAKSTFTAVPTATATTTPTQIRTPVHARTSTPVPTRTSTATPSPTATSTPSAPSFNVNPATVRAGNPVTLSGSGYPANVPVALSVGAQTYDLGVLTAGDGSFNATGAIPSGVRPGTVSLRVIAGGVTGPPVQVQFVP